MSYRLTSSWIEAFALLRADRIILDLHSQHEERREGVCELEDTESGHKTGERAGTSLDAILTYTGTAAYLN